MQIDWTFIGVVSFLIDWVLRIGFLLYIPQKRKPNAAIAWLLVIFLLPGLGILLFLIIGSPKLPKRRRDDQKQIDTMIAATTQSMPDEQTGLTKEQWTRFEPIINLTRSLGKLPAVGGNSVTILPDYNGAIEDITKQISRAKEFVHLEYFIVVLDDTTEALFDAMEAAVKRGVKVRMLIDGMGYKRYPKGKQMRKRLTDIGVEWHHMLPFTLHPKRYTRPDLRNHRKIVVIDDAIAYIGSQNLVLNSYHRKDDVRYEELVARVSGPIVRECSAVFAGDWFAETNERLAKATDPKLRPLPAKTGKVLAQILPSGPNYDTENNAHLFAEVIHAARKRVFITNPYFVPDDPILNAVTSAARRGVEVIILNSESMDQWMVGHAQRSYYAELLRAGVKVYLYKKPILLHAKHMTIDDDIAIIGSSNMDIRSFVLDLECVLVTYTPSVVSDLKKVQAKNLKRATLLTATTWSQRKFMDKFRDSIARLTAALQ